jgi:response regulator RpfG family c-di-GMP phosphodiesterase
MNQITTNPDDAADAADDFLFADEADGGATVKKEPWKVIIADDELDVHVATKLVLKEFSFRDRGIEFIDAYTGQEACDVLRKHPDAAVMFLDVVMETDDAGLRAVKRIREELGNKMVRIILRTGQPGHAPEDEVILNYDINDYKAKSEMTAKKLFTSIVAALRSFQDLQTIESSRRGLVKVLDAASSMDFRSRSLFVSGLLMQLGSLLDIGEDDLILIRRGEGGRDDSIMAAAGSYDPFVGEPFKEVFDEETAALVTQVFANGATHVDSQRSIYQVPLPNLCDVAVYVGGARIISETELALIDIFCLKIVLAYENYEFVEQSRCDQNAEIALLVRLSSHAHYLPVAYATNRGRLSRDITARMKEAGSRESIENRLPEIIERAAMLADLGNYAIPARILEADGPLSAEDRALVRTHPELGAALLKEILDQVTGGRVAGLARQIVLSHHECFDGSGYPNQLAGVDIPLPARIVAVADCYMALTSARPWRKAFPHVDAVAMIQQEAGKKFDPSVVRSFVAVSDAYRDA